MIVKKLAIRNRYKFRRVYIDIDGPYLCSLGCSFNSMYNSYDYKCELCQKIREQLCLTTTLEYSHYSYVGER